MSLIAAVAIFTGSACFCAITRSDARSIAIGGNRDAARAAGMRVDRVRIGVYVAGSMFGAIGGLIEAGYVGSVAADQGYGEGIIFNVFAAAVIGGVSLKGGRGGMLGAASGVVLLGLVQNILDLGRSTTTGSWPSTAASSSLALIMARVVGGEVTAE